MTETQAQTQPAPAPRSNEEVVERLAELAKAVDEASRAAADQPVGASRRAFALREAVEAFHKGGIARILAAIVEHPAGDEIATRLSTDPFVKVLLEMHGLVRPGIEQRILEGLVDARPWLREHGGDVEFVERDGPVVRVRLTGSCKECSLASLTLKEAVFNAIQRKAPEIERVELAEDPHDDSRPKEVIEHPGEGWEPGPNLEELPESATFRYDASEKSLLIHKRGDVLRAYENRCPHKGYALDGGLHDQDCEGELTCPWHGWRFELDSGDCVHMGDARLVPVPLMIRGGAVWVRP